MIRYEFSERPRVKNADQLDAQKIGEAIAAVRASVARKERAGERLDKDGDSVPKMLHAEANRQKNHPIEPALERDEHKAAYLHNLGVIRSLINTIRIVQVEDGASAATRAFVHIGRTENTEPGYRTTGEIIDSFSLQLALWRRAERELAAFERRYTTLRSLCPGVRKLRDVARRTIVDLETKGARGETDAGEREAPRAAS